VDSAIQTFRLDRMRESTTQVFTRDPAHVLLSRSDFPTDTHFERQQHFRKRATVRTEHDSGSHVNDPNPFLRCRFSRPFPLPAKIRQESPSGSTVFTKRFAAATTVVTNRGRTHQHFGWMQPVGERFGQKSCSLETTV